MEENQNVFIKEWPKEQAFLMHEFNLEEPCPVSIVFDPKPAQVVLRTDPEAPMDVNMAMDVRAEKPIPVCISVCEPICARSDYQIGIIFNGQPLASISVTGTTTISNCE